MDRGMPIGIWWIKTTADYSTNTNLPRLGKDLPCTRWCILDCPRHSVSPTKSSNIHHPIAFASRKVSDAENNYNTIEREGLAMVYALQKFRRYVLGSRFKFFTDHLALKYLVNKSVLGGRICQWSLLFQKFEFEVIVNPGKQNVGPNHLSRIHSSEVLGSINDNLPDAQLFWIEAVQDQFTDIATFLITGSVPT